MGWSDSPAHRLCKPATNNSSEENQGWWLWIPNWGGRGGGNVISLVSRTWLPDLGKKDGVLWWTLEGLGKGRLLNKGSVAQLLSTLAEWRISFGSTSTETLSGPWLLVKLTCRMHISLHTACSPEGEQWNPPKTCKTKVDKGLENVQSCRGQSSYLGQGEQKKELTGIFSLY